ncbi:Batten's disease protein Cln3 [Neofusicoccum parvum]|uniref:Batten's disease protein Cln3 n=1 Tax=Neofusicoccum parvum TaxID=310453 RepID=A0ACB5SF12_9PEZI|nr:Batten's disease protein Cln3 [Neofusicoccum parvum]
MIESRIDADVSTSAPEEKKATDHVLKTAGTGPLGSSRPEASGDGRAWLKNDIVAFFILGNTMALPTTILFTAAHSMFPLFTGTFILALAISAVVTSLTTRPILHLLHHNLRIILIFVGSCLAFFICTLGYHIPPGPITGTITAANVYAFATSALLESAASFDQRTVLAFSMGSGSSVLVGPPLFIGLMRAFNDDWKTVLLVCISTAVIFPCVWWLMVSKDGREVAEENRRMVAAAKKSKARGGSTDNSTADPEAAIETMTSGFGPERTRLGFFFKVLFPIYVIPQTICTSLSVIALLGVTPALMYLGVFEESPKGDLYYQLSYLVYGIAQFAFSAASTARPIPSIWVWAALQTALFAISIVQLFEPFLTYYGVWIIFVFLHGGIVGASATNTNHQIAEDFRRKGEPEDVRAFALSYGGLGSALGDIIGGGLAIMVQKLVFINMVPVRMPAP